MSKLSLYLKYVAVVPCENSFSKLKQLCHSLVFY